ncbi:unnamed protein product [Calypogeia fissa]
MGVQKLKEALNLQPHPEGGFFAETFRDDSVKLETSSLPSHFKVGRPVSTAIYFLLPTGSKSRMHIIPSAEVWHFYGGEPLTVLEVDLTGNVKHTVLGHDIEAGQVPQYVVPPRVWFGAYPTKDYKVDLEAGIIEALPVRDPEQNYSLVGCTVAPGFQFDDFEMAKRSNLVSLYPQAKSAIELLTDPE